MCQYLYTYYTSCIQGEALVKDLTIYNLKQINSFTVKMQNFEVQKVHSNCVIASSAYQTSRIWKTQNRDKLTKTKSVYIRQKTV